MNNYAEKNKKIFIVPLLLRKKVSILLFAVVLVISLVGLGLLLINNQKISSELQLAKFSILSLEDRAKTDKISFSGKIDESRIGTDPELEIMPRLYALFQQEGITINPFYCGYFYNYTCYAKILSEKSFFKVFNPVSLALYFNNIETAISYYERLPTIFAKNQYTLLPETANELQAYGIRYRRTDISHPQNSLACSVEMRVMEESEADPYGVNRLKYPYVVVSCVKLDEENKKYITIQKEIIDDLDLNQNNNLMIKSFTDNFALVGNYEECMILKKSNSIWSIIGSSSCQDPSWNRQRLPLSTVLNRDYGIPLKDAQVLSEY